MPITSAAAAASHGAREVSALGREIEAGALKCASSMTPHISSSGGSGGFLKLRGRSRITSSKRFSSIVLLLECSQRDPQLRSCRGEPALTGPFRHSQNAGDLRVRISLNVVHY